MALIADFTETPLEKLQKPFKDEATTKKQLRDSSWADGLRGISAVFVMFSHLTLAFARWIVPPSQGPGGPIAWMQLPILRLIVQGPAWVAMFFVLLGFVNGLKPLQMVRSGDIEGGLLNLSISTFRRPFRLVLPSVAATVIAWMLAQIGVFDLARQTDAYWIRITSPTSSPTWSQAVQDLFNAIRTTWMFPPENPYDQPQWALVYLLEGSLMVSLVLLTTANLAPRFRVLVIALCCYWSLEFGRKLGDVLVGWNVFAGVLFGELFHSGYPLRLAPYSRIFVVPCTVTALVLMSFPTGFEDQATWSRTLLQWFHKIPMMSEWTEVSRFWPSVGAQLLVGTVLLSPDLRKVLSHPWLLWLGRISFPLYLLHGMFMRSLLTSLLFAGAEPTQIVEGHTTYVRLPLPGIPTFLFALPVFFVVLFCAADAWAEKVEPVFGMITKKAEILMFGKAERQPALPVRTD